MSVILTDEHFTVEDVARSRNITPQAVRKAIAQCRLSAKKIAGCWFISRRELEERGWLKDES